MIKQASMPGSVRADGMSQGWAAGSRIVLLFTAFLVLLTPFTEYFWHFDHFLQGGQDFELGLLAVATIFCLVMVMLRHGKSAVTSLLSLRKWLFPLRRGAAPTLRSSSSMIRTTPAFSTPRPSLFSYSLPLQI